MNFLRILVTLLVMLELSSYTNTATQTTYRIIIDDDNNVTEKQNIVDNMASLTEQLKLIGQQIQNTKEKLKNGAAQQLLNTTQITYYKDLLVKLLDDQNDIRHKLKQKREEKTISKTKRKNEQHPIRSEIVQDLLNEKVEGEIKKLYNKSDNTVNNRKHTGCSDKKLYNIRSSHLDEGNEMSRIRFNGNKEYLNNHPKRLYSKGNRKHKEKVGVDTPEDEAEHDVPKWKQSFRSFKNSLKAHLCDIKNQKYYNRHDISRKDGKRNQKKWNEKTDAFKDKLMNEKEVMETDVKVEDEEKKKEFIEDDEKVDENEMERLETLDRQISKNNTNDNLGNITTSETIEDKPNNKIDEHKIENTFKQKARKTYVKKGRTEKKQKQRVKLKLKDYNKYQVDSATAPLEADNYSNEHDEDYNTNDIQNTAKIDNMGHKKQKTSDIDTSKIDQEGSKVKQDHENIKTSGIDQKKSKMSRSKKDQKFNVEQKDSKRPSSDRITGIAVSILCLLSFLSILSLVLGVTDYLLNDGGAKKVFSYCSVMCNSLRMRN